MKKIYYAFIITSLALMSCKKYENVEAPTPSKLIAKLWKLNTVTVTENGLPAPNVSRFNGFTLQFDGISYVAGNGNEAFPKADGTWGFDDNTYKSLTLSDGTPIQITELTASTLKLTFTRKGQLLFAPEAPDAPSERRFVPTRVYSFDLVPF